MNEDLLLLEQDVERLINQIAVLERQKNTLLQEVQVLKGKNQQALLSIRQMITKLKTIEVHS